MLDRLIRTFELGDPAVAKLLADARDTGTVAPTQTPDLVKNAKEGFFKANLALAYGRALTNRSVHDEAIESFKLTVPEAVVDPASYRLFHRADVRRACPRSRKRGRDQDRSIGPRRASARRPERYRTVAALMRHLDMPTPGARRTSTASPAR